MLVDAFRARKQCLGVLGLDQLHNWSLRWLVAASEVTCTGVHVSLVLAFLAGSEKNERFWLAAVNRGLTKLLYELKDGN